MNASFADYVALLDHLLKRRQEVVDRIEGTLLNVQGKALSKSRDRAHFSHLLDTCVFGVPGLPRELWRLRGQLAARHLADGFEPVLLERHTHELDPLELIVRAYHHWDHHRWPGRSGRLTFGQAVFAVFMLRQIEHLSLRVWDDRDDGASARVREVQTLLDTLNSSAVPAAFVRDARWLMQTAQGALTRRLDPYFRVAEHAASLAHADRLAFHKAGARLAGGHLRSQLRYRASETGRPIDDPDILTVTRNSNSMDVALLVGDLVALLEAYDHACTDGDDAQRLDLADAILQGLSADPELCLTRLDLLRPCTMIEDLFIETAADGRARYSGRGEAHVACVDRYCTLIGQQAGSLADHARTLDPATAVYSPYGITYGFCADILSNMAHCSLVSPSSTDLCLEDMFSSRGRLDEKLARAHAWAALPTRDGEHAHFDHSSEWAGLMVGRLTSALEARASQPTRDNASAYPDARIFVVPSSVDVESLPPDFPPMRAIPALEHCVTSDLARAFAGAAEGRPKSRMLADRIEGRFLASTESDGKWLGISKNLLTTLTSRGQHALLTDVPAAAIDVLRLTCPGLLSLP